MPDPLAGPSIGFILVLGAAIVMAIAHAALFSALEAVLATFGEARLMAERDKGGSDGETAARILQSEGSLAARLLAGHLLGFASAVGLAVYLLDRTLGGNAGGLALGCAIGVIALLHGLSAVMARAFLSARPHLLFRLLRWTRPLELALLPLGAPLALLYGIARRVFFLEDQADPEDAVREVEHMIEKSEEIGGITEEFADLLKGVIEFKDTVAREVMVPRTRTVAFEISAPIAEILDTIEAEGHSRYPVYRERVDEVEGILYAKDLFRALRARGRKVGEVERKLETPEGVSLAALIRKPAFFVAESHKIGSLLREMQSRRFHLAVVVDEFGGTSGIVTLEDIVEEIVGEIQDEHDPHEDLIQELEPGQKYLADATVSIYDLGDRLDTDLVEDGGYDSLGGMIVQKLENRVPQAGQSLSVGPFDFIVREADEKHVTQVEIVRRPDLPQASVE